MVGASRIPVVLLIVALLVSAARSEPRIEWFESGPGTITQARADERGPDGSEARQITFDPSGNRPEYWCGAGVALAKASGANAMTFYAKASATRAVEFKVFDSDGAYGYYSAKVADDWVKIDVRRESPVRMGNGDGPLKDISKLEFIFNNKQFAEKTPFRLFVSAITFTTIAPRKFLYPNWMPSTTPSAVPGYRIGTCLHTMWGEGNGEFFGFDKPGGYEVAVNVVDHLVQQYGNIEITVAQWRLTGELGKKFCDYVKSKGGIPMAEGHHGGVELAPAINIHGQTGKEAGFPAFGLHSQDLTDPKLIAKVQQMQLLNAQAGAVAWRIVDYIWPYWGGGVWGYSPAALTAWRQVLNETDGGFPIVDGATTRDTHFWEYFESYLGYRMSPKDLGLASWDEYLPPQAKASESPQLENNRLLHNLLFHYWWVKYCSDVAIPAAKYGSLSQPIPNPESFANGSDYYWLLKAALVRGASLEWWGGSDIIVPNYYNGRYYDNVARKNGRELILHGETAAAGGRPYGDEYRPHYWDNQANYLITYAQSASVDFKGKHDQYWGSRWEKMTDPDYPEYQSYTGFRSAWCGFLQCRNDKAVKPKTDVLALTRRPIARGGAPFDSETEGRQAYNLARDLIELNYLHDGAALPIDDAYDIEQYRTIFQCNVEPPKKMIERLGQWLSEREDHTLVTHSFVPTRFAAPAPIYSEDRMLQPGGMEKTFGFSSLVQTKTRSGVVRSQDPAFTEALGELQGATIQLATGLFRTGNKAKVLVYLGDEPLVSEWSVGKGRVIYLHFIPQETGITGRKLQTAISDGVMRYLGYKPSGISPTHRVLAFDRPTGGKVYVALYPEARSQTLGPDGHVYGVFQAQDPELKASARVLVESSKAYFITDMITGKRETITSDKEGYLSVNLDGWNLRGFYVDAK